MIRSILFTTLFSLIFIASSQDAVATPLGAGGDLILNLSGTAGSNVVNFEATGSGLTTSVAVVSLSGSSPLRMPTGGSEWDAAFDNDIGDALNFLGTSLNDDLNLTGGGISVRKNGVVFTIANTIDLDPAAGTNDDIEVDPPSTNYPALTENDVISWTGSGTFTLESGTFDTIFNIGIYTNPLSTGNYTVNVFTAVPEPGMLALLSLASMGAFGVRRL